MLSRVHVAPFLRAESGSVRVSYLTDPDKRIVPFLDRLCRLIRRLEGWPRAAVIEALRRQERRVRDTARLAGISKTLLDLCEFRPPPGAELSARVREAVFRARGDRWPPVPGDHHMPYDLAALQLGRTAGDVAELLYADQPGARLLVRVPVLSGRALLARYNLELARGVLLNAESVRLTARGGWRGIFRAVKAARLMHVVRRVGRSYELEVTGPAAAFIVRPARYGVRLARVVPALARAPGWRLEADVHHDGALLEFRARGRPRGSGTRPAVGKTARRPRYDSEWERSLAADFRRHFREERDGWRLSREAEPVMAGNELFLPDFTLRHSDGREALIELVGFWTPEYLIAKARKVRAAGMEHLILVVYRGLAVGATGHALDSLIASVDADRVVWFAQKPRAAEVVRAAERWAR
ncbi:MAG: DUF790 family protein [Gemmatimonadaceae bacterium]